MDREKVIKEYEDYVSSYIPVTTYGDYVLEMHKAVLTLLKGHDAVEKNKECHEDKIAVECLNAIQTVNKYIDEEEDECGCTYWKDKKGYAFHADIGYFFEGLDNFEKYLIKRLKKEVSSDA